jgi:hypothetical protein
MNAKRITGLIFYAETINSERYVGLIVTEFFRQLIEEELSYAWLQQDSTTAHTADDTLMALEGVYSDRIISHGLQTAHTPDLTTCNFY